MFLLTVKSYCQVKLVNLSLQISIKLSFTSTHPFTRTGMRQADENRAWEQSNTKQDALPIAWIVPAVCPRIVF